MTREEFRNIFDSVFNGLKNPIFICVEDYFEKDNFLFEIASPRPYSDCRLAKTHYHYVEPIMLFDILFTDACIKGYWVTVLEKVGDKYVHRTDLSKHIDTYDNNIEFKQKLINELIDKYEKKNIQQGGE